MRNLGGGKVISEVGSGSFPAMLVRIVARTGLTVWRVAPIVLGSDESGVPDDIELHCAKNDVVLVGEAGDLIRRKSFELDPAETDLVIIPTSVLADLDPDWSGHDVCSHDLVRQHKLVPAGREAICRLAFGFTPPYMASSMLLEIVASGSDGEVDSNNEPLHLSMGFTNGIKFIRGAHFPSSADLSSLRRRLGLVFRFGDTDL